jgi:thymidylate synthase (FAD)
MQVKLVAATLGLAEAKSGQDLISFIARVSNPKGQLNFETAPKLLAYLIKHKHWSPFEHVYMTVEITTSRGIAAQILRHRSFCFQEASQRYSEATSYEEYLARRQDLKNRQNSIDDMDPADAKWFLDAQESVWSQSYQLYKEALEKGIAKEQARFLLPLNTKTVLFMTGSLRSWIHYIELRTEAGTQKEHREIAEQIKIIFCMQYPDVARALGWIKE